MNLTLFNILPRELMSMIVSYLSDTEMCALSRTCRNVLSVMRKVWAITHFWYDRYQRVTSGSNCDVNKVLPDFVENVGWMKLYQRHQNFLLHLPSALNTTCYVGPTGNFYCQVGWSYQLVATLPVQEVLHLEKENRQYILVYLDFSGSVKYCLIRVGIIGDRYWMGEGVIFDKIIKHHIDERFIICYLQDNVVVISNDRRRMNNFFRPTGDEVPIEHIGLDFVAADGNAFHVHDDSWLMVDCDRVIYSHQGNQVFVWDRKE